MAAHPASTSCQTSSGGMPELAPRSIKPLRIAVVTINYAPEPTGISVYSTGLAEFLAGQAHQVTVYSAFSYYPAWKKSPSDERRVFRLEQLHDVALRRSYVYVPNQPTALRRMLHELSFSISASLNYLLGPTADVTVVVTPPLLLGTFIALAARIKRSKVVLHVQDLQPDAAVDLGMLKQGLLTDVLFALEKLNYRLAHRVSTISQAMLQKIAAKGVPTRKAILFKNWADDNLDMPHLVGDDFRLEWDLKDRFVVLYAGNMGVKQGLQSLLDTAELLQYDPRFLFVIVGDGGEKEALMAIAKAKRLDNVIFRSPVEKVLLGRLLAMPDVSVITQKAGINDLVLPSKLGNLLASRKPVVAAAAPHSELANILNETRGGIVCEPEDSKAMAKALLDIARDPEAAAEMARRGACYARDHLSRTSILEGFSRQLDELVNTSSGEALNKFSVSAGWSLSVLMRRVAWIPFRLLFLRGTTRYLSPLRVAVLRLFGATLGRHVLICDGVKVWFPWNLKMKDGSTLGPGVEVYNFAPVEIGADAAVSQYSYLCTATHDHHDLKMPLTFHPIVIGDHAWIAAGSFVGPGVSIGAGAVVGARAVVTRDVRAWMVVAGNPAKEVNSRRIKTS